MTPDEWQDDEDRGYRGLWVIPAAAVCIWIMIIIAVWKGWV